MCFFSFAYRTHSNRSGIAIFRVVPNARNLDFRHGLFVCVLENQRPIVERLVSANGG